MPYVNVVATGDAFTLTEFTHPADEEAAPRPKTSVPVSTTIQKAWCVGEEEG